MTQGRFIVIDGSEGAGKSTQINYIRDWLSEHHIDFLADPRARRHSRRRASAQYIAQSSQRY